MPSEGAWPKPSQLAVATGKGALQLAPDEQHPPSDKVARSEATQNVFITHQIRFSGSSRYRKIPRAKVTSCQVLIAPTEALQERRRLSILHRLVLRSGILCGRHLYPCILLSTRPFSGALHGPYLCPRISDGPDLAVLLADRCPSIFCNLGRGILHKRFRDCFNRLHRPDLCLRILLGRPSLELPQQGCSRWLTFAPTLIRFESGNNFIARRLVSCCRRQSLSAGG